MGTVSDLQVAVKTYKSISIIVTSQAQLRPQTPVTITTVITMSITTIIINSKIITLTIIVIFDTTIVMTFQIILTTLIRGPKIGRTV